MISFVKSPLLKGQRIEGRLPLEAKIGFGSIILTGVILIIFGLGAAASGSRYNDGCESVMIGVALVALTGFILHKFYKK